MKILFLRFFGNFVDYAFQIAYTNLAPAPMKCEQRVELVRAIIANLLN